MAKGRPSSLLSLNNGGLSFHRTESKSKCCRCKTIIPAGTICGELKKIEHGFSKQKRHCTECSKQILEITQNNLDKLIQEFSALGF